MSFSAIKSRFGRGGGTGLSPITISLKDGFVGPSRSACVEELAAAFRGRGLSLGVESDACHGTRSSQACDLGFGIGAILERTTNYSIYYQQLCLRFMLIFKIFFMI